MARSRSKQPLLGPRVGSERDVRNTSSGGSSRVNRILLFIVVLCVLGMFSFFQREVKGLNSMIATDQEKISSLQRVVKGQESIIERFNSSITNSDVLARLHSFEQEILTNEKQLSNHLDDVQSDISKQLSQTLNELGDTVHKAEHEIQDEVSKVKKDVDSYMRTTQDQFSMENSFMVYQLAGTFTLLSCLISMWHMTAHLRKFNQPIVQRKILAILWMCPIYAITSWFSLVFHEAEGYLAILKDFYEAYIIYQFLSFCIAVLGRGDREAVVDLLVKHADHLTPPFRFDALCNPNPYESDRALAHAVLLQCQLFAMQFVFFRPLTTTSTFILEKFKYYGPTGNAMDWRSPQFYLTALQNFSVFIAFTGLLKFYHAVDKELIWCRPFAKFMCIKGVVFMTFWQGLAISILASATDVAGDDPEKWARSAQNFLICLEMLLFSIAHFYTFPTEEWEDGYRAAHENSTKFGDSIALGDFFQDLKIIFKSNKKKRKSQLPPIEDVEDDTTMASSVDDNGFDPSSAIVAALSSDSSGSPDKDVEDARERVRNRIMSGVGEDLDESLQQDISCLGDSDGTKEDDYDEKSPLLGQGYSDTYSKGLYAPEPSRKPLNFTLDEPRLMARQKNEIDSLKHDSRQKEFAAEKLTSYQNDFSANDSVANKRSPRALKPRSYDEDDPKSPQKDAIEESVSNQHDVTADESITYLQNVTVHECQQEEASESISDQQDETAEAPDSYQQDEDTGDVILDEEDHAAVEQQEDESFPDQEGIITDDESVTYQQNDIADESLSVQKDVSIESGPHEENQTLDVAASHENDASSHDTGEHAVDTDSITPTPAVQDKELDDVKDDNVGVLKEESLRSRSLNGFYFGVSADFDGEPMGGMDPGDDSEDDMLRPSIFTEISRLMEPGEDNPTPMK